MERYNQTIQRSLLKLVNDKQDTLLDGVMLNYRTQLKMKYACPHNSDQEFEEGQTKMLIKSMYNVLKNCVAKSNLSKAQKRYKSYSAPFRRNISVTENSTRMVEKVVSL